MEIGADIHETDGPGEGPGEVVRLLPVAVLVLSPDRSFRAASTMLLSRRGCSVLSAASEEEALEQAGAEPVDVLVVELQEEASGGLHARAAVTARRIDAAGAGAGRRVAPIGVVVVGEADELGESIEAEAGTAHPVLDKWGPFERLYQAICDRDRARRLVRAERGDERAWPPPAFSRRAV